MTWKALRSVDYIVIHCAATTASQDIGAAEITTWHRQKGWLDIGYHYVIRRDGTVEKGRQDGVPGAHARGFNHLSLGVCLAGGVAADGKTAEDNFTPAQYAALGQLVEGLIAQYPDAEVLGHRDLPKVNKACPSFEVKEWWAKYLAEKN